MSLGGDGMAPPQPASLSGGGGDGVTTVTATAGGPLPFQAGAVVPSSCPSSTTNVVNVGYYQSWAKYRPSGCHPLRAADIPVREFGYTHLIYSFAGISSAGEVGFYNGVAEEASLYRDFNGLKAVHVGLHTLVAVGGWNLDQALFVRAAADPGARSRFARSAARFLREHGFDGLDLDWEYPVSRHGTPRDRENYVLLVEAVRQALDAEGAGYLLTVALPVGPDKLDAGFDLPGLARHADWFHLMSYDVHGAWDAAAGANTDLEYIADAVENHILARGVRGDQLVFGLAAYGRSMLLTDPHCTTAGCPIDGAGAAGCAGEPGFAAYFELREKHVDAGRYDSLLINERTGSMEMVVEGNVFVSLDVEVTFEKKRDYYLSK